MKPLPTTALASKIALALALAVAPLAFAQQDMAGDAPAEKKPADKPAADKPTKGPRLVQPWSKMDSLTAEQKTQIAALHKQATLDKKKIDEKENDDILALLTPEQKTELEKVKEDATTAAKKKAKPAAGDAKPSTQPAND